MSQASVYEHQTARTAATATTVTATNTPSL